MSLISASAGVADLLVYSKIFERRFSQITNVAIAQIDVFREGPVYSTGEVSGCSQGRAFFRRLLRSGLVNRSETARLSQGLAQLGGCGRPEASASQVVELLDLRQIPDNDIQAGQLDGPTDTGTGGAHAPGDGWVGFELLLQTSEGHQETDRVFLRLGAAREQTHCGEILRAIWPVLRDDCLMEQADKGLQQVEQALLWTISTRTNSAVLILDRNCQLLDCNEAGREYLSTKKLLRLSDAGFVRCNSDLETSAFAKSLRLCAQGGTQAPPTDGSLEISRIDEGELTVFMYEQGSDQALPVNISRYQPEGAGDPLVVVILPRQPEQTRIEHMAQQMGLSPTEARVAALIQLGLSNREAAHIAGVKEQTFKTYAKRVLSKMNVTCRAEVAQKLTWQSAWGRIV